MALAASCPIPAQREPARTPAPTCSAASLKRKRAAEPETAKSPQKAPAHRARCALASQCAPRAVPRPWPRPPPRPAAMFSAAERSSGACERASRDLLLPNVGSPPGHMRRLLHLPRSFYLPSQVAGDSTLLALGYLLSRFFCAKAEALSRGSAGPGRRRVWQGR